MNILLTSAGRRSYMIEYFKKALKGKGKVFASNSQLTYTLLQADDYIITPTIYDKKYIDFLIDYCKLNTIQVVISLFDIDLPILAKNRHRFEEFGITLVVSDYEVTQICNDKWKTFLFLQKEGINQPLSFINLSAAKEAINSGKLKFPVILKPRWGMGSIGIYKVENEEELTVIYKMLSREIFNTYLKYESLADNDSCVIIQQLIDGDEYGIEILNDLKGDYVTTFAKKKLAMRSGETDVAITVDPSPFNQIARIISGSLKHIALLDVDCFIDSKKNINILEMNCRFGGQYPFTHLSGANVPMQIINWIESGSTDMSILRQTNNIQVCKEIYPTIFNSNKNDKN